ncbi:MAG: dolichyl-phosphate beta-glucosyltransferase [Bryobacteraceae bacterium]
MSRVAEQSAFSSGIVSGNPDVTLILPAYNEVRTIAATMCEAIAYFTQRGLRWELIVAADGTDGTREAARAVAVGPGAIQVIGHEGRCGKGRGIREGVALAAGSIIGFADADNKVPIAEFDQVRAALDAGAGVVIGSRGLRNSQIERCQPWYRRAGGKAFRVAMRTVAGLPTISDSQCGFKFFQRNAAKELFCRQRIDGYMFDVEILVLASRLGYVVREVPVRWRDDGDSRLNLIAGNLRNARDILRIRYLHRRVRPVAARDESAAAVR